MIGETLIAWSIRISLILFASVLIARTTGRWSPRIELTLKCLWTAGCLLAIGHVLAAFHFHFAWSHDAAFEETAKRTQESIGVSYGQGVYFNYLFLGMWALDVVLDWFPPRSSPRLHRWISGVCVAFLIFIAFNGTVIFKDGATRLIGIVVTLTWIICLAMRWLHNTPSRIQASSTSPQRKQGIS